jgi:hypothetical protein
MWTLDQASQQKKLHPTHSDQPYVKQAKQAQLGVID